MSPGGRKNWTVLGSVVGHEADDCLSQRPIVKEPALRVACTTTAPLNPAPRHRAVRLGPAMVLSGRTGPCSQRPGA